MVTGVNLTCFVAVKCHRQARAGIQEIHFLPFNPTDKRTALTYLDRDGKMHRVSKGAPEQVPMHKILQYHILSDNQLT